MTDVTPTEVTPTTVTPTEPKEEPKPTGEHYTKTELDERLTAWEHRHDEIRRELADSKAQDAEEKAELREQLRQATEYIETLKKAEQDRNKVNESSSTIVAPPSSIPPAQPNIPPPPPVDSTTGKPKKTWKHAW